MLVGCRSGKIEAQICLDSARKQLLTILINIDIMREVDLSERKMIKSYEVPTGPANSYRMDDTCLLINRSDLRRWKRHENSTKQGRSDEFDFMLHYPYVEINFVTKFPNKEIFMQRIVA